MPLNPIDYLSRLWPFQRVSTLILATLGPLLVIAALALLGNSR